jgi:uncharacterized membrane protein
MLCYHLIYDLAYFGVYSGNMLSTPWQTFARSIGTTFIAVMGISLTLRYARLKPELDRKHLFVKYLRRGLTLLAWGMVITAVTYLVIGPGFVVFGILHLLGLSTILACPFLRSRWASLVGGVFVIALGTYVSGLITLSPWLLWLGVQQIGRRMVDYYPLAPWFGVALLGVFVGFSLYPEGRRGYPLPDLSRSLPVRGLGFLGRHSLLIYLVHQPVLFAFLIVVGVGYI